MHRACKPKIYFSGSSNNKTVILTYVTGNILLFIQDKGVNKTVLLDSVYVTHSINTASWYRKHSSLEWLVAGYN